MPGGYRVTGEWHFASGSRQANWMGAHCHVVEPDGSLRLNRFGRPTVRTLLFPKDKATPIHDWNTLGMRGTASEGYACKDVFVPEEFSGTREDPTPAARHAGRSTPSRCRGCTRSASPAWRSASPAPCSTRSWSWPPQDAARPRPAGRQPGGAVRRRAARGRLGSARAYLVEILKESGTAPTTSSRSARPQRARVRLGCTPGDPVGREDADYVYKAAGTSAIFLGTPFERRFRDIHTLSQQIQSREAHFETVGRSC